MPLKYKGFNIEIIFGANALNQPEYAFRVFIKDETLHKSDHIYENYEAAIAAATSKIDEFWEEKQNGR